MLANSSSRSPGPHKVYALDPATQDPLHSLRVDVDAGLGHGSESGDFYGVSCFSSRPRVGTVGDTGGYAFEVNSLGRYRISWEPGGGSEPIRLTSGVATRGLLHSAGYGLNHLRAECLLNPQHPTVLRFIVNGQTLAELKDKARIGALHGALLLSSSANPRPASIVGFDNLAMSTQTRSGFLRRLLDDFASG